MAVMQWIKGKKDLLLFTGTPGCGKTYFCAAMWNHDQDNNIFESCRLWKEADLLERIRTQMNNGRDHLADAKELCDDELIIIDDIGCTGVNEWRNSVYLTIIDHRVSSRKPTVLTTNLSKDALAVDVGLRIYSRVMAHENTFVEMLTGDLRRNPIIE